MLSGNRGVALGCIAFGGIMYLVPYFARKSVVSKDCVQSVVLIECLHCALDLSRRIFPSATQ
jgi:hypothetical protein